MPPGGGAFRGPPQGFPPGYAPRVGFVAWEDKQRGLLDRWWSTVKEVLFNTRAFHEASAQSEDPWPSVTFAMTTAAFAGTLMGAFFAMFYLAFAGLFATALGAGTRHAGPGLAAGGLFAGMGMAMAVIYPVMFVLYALVFPWIAGGINHLCLSLLGGVTRPYSSTVRVIGYSWAAYFWVCIPGLGGVIAVIFLLISLITGLDATHKCGGGKAALAIFLPGILACGCCCTAQMLFGGLGAFLRH